MSNAANSASETPTARPKDAPDGALDPAEASENAPPAPAGDAAAAHPLAQLGAGLQSAAPQAPGPSDPKRRSFPDPGNRGEASASDELGCAAAGAPSPAPLELVGVATAWTPAKLGPILSSGPAGPAR